MEITGTIYRILPKEEVTLGDGTKKMKGGFVIMCEGEYAKPLAFELFGDERLALLTGITVGMPVKAFFLPVSFEGKNGRYHSTLRCTNIFPLTTAAPASNPSSITSNPPMSDNSKWTTKDNMTSPEQQPQTFQAEEGLPFDDDIPFY